MIVLRIKPQETYDWILKKHYARRLCPITYAFGIYEDSIECLGCTD